MKLTKEQKENVVAIAQWGSLAVLAGILIVVLLFGFIKSVCDIAAAEKERLDAAPIVLVQECVDGICIYQDRETGTQYISKSRQLTPRLNEDGSLYIGAPIQSEEVD